MIAELRAYFVGLIQTIDSDFVSIDDPFGDDDIANANLTKGFKLYFGDINNIHNDESYVEELPMTIEIYKEEGREAIESFDQLLDLGIQIKNCFIDPKQSRNQTLFNDIVAGSIVAEPIISNDKTIKVKLEFIIRKDFIFI